MEPIFLLLLFRRPYAGLRVQPRFFYGDQRLKWTVRLSPPPDAHRELTFDGVTRQTFPPFGGCIFHLDRDLFRTPSARSLCNFPSVTQIRSPVPFVVDVVFIWHLMADFLRYPPHLVSPIFLFGRVVFNVIPASFLPCAYFIQSPSPTPPTR